MPENARAASHQSAASTAELQRRDVRIAILETALAESAATRAIEAAGGPLEQLLPMVMKDLRTRVVEQRGEKPRFETFVHDPITPASPRLNRNGHTMTADDLVAELKAHPAIGRLFEGGPTKKEPRKVSLTRAQSRDPLLYARLKAQRERGEIDSAYNDQGQRII